MELWKNLTLLLELETVYSLVLVLIATAILLIERIVKKDFSISLFSVFLLAVTVPLVSVRPLCKYSHIPDDIKPIMYFVFSFRVLEIIKYIGNFIKGMLEIILKPENLNKILQFGIQTLTRLQLKEEPPKDQNDVN